jgi:hypothetical protein
VLLQAGPEGSEAVCDLVSHLHDIASMRQSTLFRFPFVLSSEIMNNVSILDSVFCIDEVLFNLQGYSVSQKSRCGDMTVCMFSVRCH